MACGCKKRTTKKFRWVSDDNPDDVVIYDSEIAAKAKVIRKGGSYEPA